MKTVIRRPANHALHVFLTLITLGCWLPVWAVAAIVGRRETVTVPDSPGAFQGPYGMYRPGVPPPWTSGATHIRYCGHNWLWNPWTNRWDMTL